MSLITIFSRQAAAAYIIASAATIASFWTPIDPISNNLYSLFNSIIRHETPTPSEFKFEFTSEPGHHLGIGPVKGSRAHELDILELAEKQHPNLISNLEKQLYTYDPHPDPRDSILVFEDFLGPLPQDQESKELTDRVNHISCAMYSTYIDKYRSYGITEVNAVDWIEEGRSETHIHPDLNNGTAHAIAIKKGHQFKTNRGIIPACQIAIHELMHVEEYKPNSYKASEVLTVTRDLIHLDLIRKQILGHSVDQEEPYKTTLEIRSNDGRFTKTCSIPLSKYINFYRELEKKKNSLGEAIGSPESIQFLTNCPSRFAEFIALYKSVQEDKDFETALNYVKAHIVNTDGEFRKSGLLLLKELVKQGQIDDEAMETVIANINVFNQNNIPGETIDLLNEYLIREKGFVPIWNYVVNNINDPDGNLQAALIILKELIKHGKYDEQFAIQTGISYGWYSPLGNGIIEELFKSKKGFVPVYEYVRANIGNKKKLERFNAFRLLTLLNKFEQIDDSFTIKNLISLLQDPNSESRHLALELFKQSFKDGKYIHSAIEQVNALLKSKEWSSKETAYKLLAVLVEHGHCEKKAVDLAIAEMSDPSFSSEYRAFLLVPKLIQRGEGIDRFFGYAKKNLNSPESTFCQRSQKLLAELGKNGYFPNIVIPKKLLELPPNSISY